MKYTHLLFDLDGTLIDTLEGVIKCAQYSLRHYGIEKTLDEVRPFLGPPLRYSFEKYGVPQDKIVEAIEKYRERYDRCGAAESRVFDGVPKMLSNLKNAGYKLGVATSKYEEYAKIMLKEFGLADNFTFITGSNLDETISKKHEVIEEALRRFGMTGDRSKVLMIGDMRFDIGGARIANVDSFGIYTGTAQENEHENAGATYIAHSFAETEKILLGFINE